MPGHGPPTGTVRGVVNRNALRAGVVGAVVTLMMFVAAPAFAYTVDDGSDAGPGLSVAETLGLFVVLPIAIFAVIALLVCLPSITRRKS